MWNPYLPSTQRFLQFWYLWGVYFTNPNDAILTSLSILQIMQMKSTIMQNLSFQYNSVNLWPNLANKVTKPIFSGSRNSVKAKGNWFGLQQHLHSMQISSAIMQNSIFKHNLVNSQPNLANKVTKPMFSWSRNKTKAIRNWFGHRPYPHNMQIRSAIMQKSFFKHNSLNSWQNLEN